MEVHQQRLNTEQHGQFRLETAGLTPSRENSKPDATTLERGPLRQSSAPPGVSRLLDHEVEVFKSLVGAAAAGSQFSPHMKRHMTQTVFPEEAKRLLTSRIIALTGDSRPSILDASDSRTSTRSSGRGVSVSLNEDMTPTQSIEKASFRLREAVAHGDHLDSMLKELQSLSLDVPVLRGLANRKVNVRGSEKANDSDLIKQDNPLHRTIADDHGSPVVEQTRLIDAAPMNQMEWVEVGASLGQLRQQAKTLPGHRSRLEVPSLRDAERDTPSKVTETSNREPFAYEQGGAPAEQVSKRVESHSFTPGGASPMFDYEVRRILELGTRLMEETTKAGRPRPLVSPLPNPRTRM
ncbi:MAG: hypothetical protein ACLQGP_07990 [Isosphaeraceae bacterium]